MKEKKSFQISLHKWGGRGKEFQKYFSAPVNLQTAEFMNKYNGFWVIMAYEFNNS